MHHAKGAARSVLDQLMGENRDGDMDDVEIKVSKDKVASHTAFRLKEDAFARTSDPTYRYPAGLARRARLQALFDRMLRTRSVLEDHL